MHRYEPPQPFEMLDHTADAAVRVRGASAEETLGRLAVVFGQLLTGDTGAGMAGSVQVEATRRLTAEPGDRAMMAIDILRELLYRFSTEGVVPVRCEVRGFDPDAGAEVEIGFGPYDPEAHSEGMDIKAVTLHEALFDPVPDGWVVQVLFDV